MFFTAKVSKVISFIKFWEPHPLINRITFSEGAKEQIKAAKKSRLRADFLQEKIRLKIARNILDSPKLFAIAERATSIKVEKIIFMYIPEKPVPIISSAMVILQNDIETTYELISLM